LGIKESATFDIFGAAVEVRILGESSMRFLACLCVAFCLSACATASLNWADDRPPVGVQGPKPMCSSGPGGKTAACATAILENTAIQSKK
jgi:hypothetical protein